MQLNEFQRLVFASHSRKYYTHQDRRSSRSYLLSKRLIRSDTNTHEWICFTLEVNKLREAGLESFEIALVTSKARENMVARSTKRTKKKKRVNETKEKLLEIDHSHVM